MNNLTLRQQRVLFEETIKLAERGLNKGKYPIGALIADEKGEILAKSYNKNTLLNDVTAHAEIICLRKLGNAKLSKE